MLTDLSTLQLLILVQLCDAESGGFVFKQSGSLLCLCSLAHFNFKFDFEQRSTAGWFQHLAGDDDIDSNSLC